MKRPDPSPANDHPPVLETRLTRRHLLRGAATCATGLAAAALVGCGGDDGPGTTASPSATTSATAPRSSAPARSPRIRQFLPLTTPAPTIITEAQHPPPIAITNARLFDGTGAAPTEGNLILVRNGMIEDIRSGGPVPSGYESIDASGQTVTPGLIDGHVHITRSIFQVTQSLSSQTKPEGLLPFLQQGFTGLRDVGTATVAYSSVSTTINGFSQANIAPDIAWAGPIITAPGGYPFTNPRYTASGQDILSPEEGAGLVDQLADNGARIIKIAIERGFHADEGWPLLSPEEISAITARAGERGLLVTAHVTDVEETQVALDNGVHSLAHTPLVPLPDDVIARMAEEGRATVTTATIWDPDSAANAAQNALRLAEAGGVVSIGTDFGCCGQVAGIEAFLQEMQFLKDHGFTNTQLLVAATRGGAYVSNTLADTGSIEPNKRADLIILNGNPLTDLNAIRNVTAVIKRGHLIAV